MRAHVSGTSCAAGFTAFVATALEEETPRHHGRWYLVLHPADGSGPELMLPDWDIHPEMISHTRVVDIRTGRPFPQPTPEFMENWEWSQTRSADELTAYMAYALECLRAVGLPCEGVTTPGGFGSRNDTGVRGRTCPGDRHGLPRW